MTDLRTIIDDACSGHDVHVVAKILNELRNKYIAAHIPYVPPEASCCPQCGGMNVQIVESVDRNNRKNGSKGMICKDCRLFAARVTKQEMMHSWSEGAFTPAVWDKIVIQRWNALPRNHINMFDVLDDLYGTTYQKNIAAEEVFELIEALTRYGKRLQQSRRNDRPEGFNQVMTEMADVIITIHQLMASYNEPESSLSSRIEAKLTKLKCNESVRSAIRESLRRTTTTLHTNVRIVE